MYPGKKNHFVFSGSTCRTITDNPWMDDGLLRTIYVLPRIIYGIFSNRCDPGNIARVVIQCVRWAVLDRKRHFLKQNNDKNSLRFLKKSPIQMLPTLGHAVKLTGMQFEPVLIALYCSTNLNMPLVIPRIEAHHIWEELPCVLDLLRFYKW